MRPCYEPSNHGPSAIFHLAPPPQTASPNGDQVLEPWETILIKLQWMNG